MKSDACIDRLRECAQAGARVCAMARAGIVPCDADGVVAMQESTPRHHHAGAARGIFAALLAVAFATFSFAASYTTIDSATAVDNGGASGGDIVRMIDNGNRTLDIIHIFTNTSASASLSLGDDNMVVADTLSFLVVGGGGSGGADCGGGGGAGGLIYQSGLNLAVGTATVTVGTGGVEVVKANNVQGNNGGDSTLIIGGVTYTAKGGGGGGCYDKSGGRNGGCGGGGFNTYAAGSSTQATPGVGFAGGAANGTCGGGGGGAGGTPAKASTGGVGGVGGPGLEYDISGESQWYAGGGAGGSNGTTIDRSLGGSGVGGDGGSQKNTALYSGLPGKDGTGSGGGGACGGIADRRVGAKGGTGIVIIRYKVLDYKKAVIGGQTIRFRGASETNWVDGELAISFTNTVDEGELILPSYMQAWVLAVGGGGAGANPTNGAVTVGGAGGGGAGGYVESTNMFATGTYLINIGAGGVSPMEAGAGGDGDNSTITLPGSSQIIAHGGGGGGFKSVGNDGGSGGGGSKAAGGEANTFDDNIANAGGAGSHNTVGGGGGGAGGVGKPSVRLGVAGDGGEGKYSEITGAKVLYAAGGGGGARSGTGGLGQTNYLGVAVGGSGGGGNTKDSVIEATPGLDGTGSGGGGGGGSYPAKTTVPTHPARTGGLGGNGGSGIVVIRIVNLMPEQPEASYDPIVYDGELHEIYPANVAYERSGDYAKTDVGNYNFAITLNDDFCWSDGDVGSPKHGSWSIIPAELQVVDFHVDRWQIDDEANDPVLVLALPCGKTVSTDDYDVVFQYCRFGEGSWSSTVPTDAGEYYARAIITPKTGNITAPSATPQTTFEISDNRVAIAASLGYSVDISVSTFTGNSTLTNFPMLVKISEGSPAGFSYNQTAADGSDLRFTDADGFKLPYEIEKWDITGTSYVWVKVPEYKKDSYACTMHWGAIAGEDVPETEDPQKVWSDYIGVWHFAEQSGTAFDATGHGLDGTPSKGSASEADPSRMVAGGGVVGDSRINDTMDVTKGNYMSVPNFLSVTNPAGIFTVSGWFKLSSFNTQTRLISQKNASGENGWELIAYSKTKLYMRSDGDTKTAAADVPDMTANWVYATAVYSNTWGRIYINGGKNSTYSYYYTQTGFPGTTPRTDRKIAFGNLANAGERSLAGMYDEIRISAGMLSADWILADFEQIGTNGEAEGPDFGEIHVKTNVVYDNHWIIDPSISSPSWMISQASTITIDPGRPAYGEPVYWVFSQLNGTAYTNVQASALAAGSYELVFHAHSGANVDSEWSWNELESDVIYVMVIDESPNNSLGGTVGDATLSGRILLANNDSNPIAPITGQAYNNTSPANAVFWIREDGDTFQSTDYPNIANRGKQANRRLVAREPVEELCDGTNLWILANVLQGTPFNSNASALQKARRNILPFSPTSVSGIARLWTNNVYNLVFRNIENSQVISPCYTNGIGTIYFDAVNSSIEEAGSGYNLVVETVTGETAMGDDIDNSAWTAVDMRPLYTSGGTFEERETTKTLALDVTTGNYGIKDFYRVVVPINYAGPIRFRIRRTSIPSSETYALDEDGFILVDNVIASYPAMRADLEPMGVFDPSVGGKAVLGTAAAWSSPFPAISEEGVKPRAKATYLANPGDTNANMSTFITAAYMHYRWRYLDQQVEDTWHTVPLDPATARSTLSNSTAFLTSPRTIDIPDAVGDLEYWFDVVLNAPYYKYVDYSGTDLGLEYTNVSGTHEYTEHLASVTNTAGVVAPYESRGTNWFVRLREGESSYEGLEVQYYMTKKRDGEGERSYVDAMTGRWETASLELIGNHTWRGNLQTLNATNLHYRIAMKNLQDASKSDYQYVTNASYYVLTGDATNSWPVTSTLVEGDTNSWNYLWADAATGFLMFQIDDSTKAITMVHSDYQDVNKWSDANNTNGLFTGNATFTMTDGTMSGTSHKAKVFVEDFADWTAMPVSLENWNESFTLGATSLDEGYYKPFPSATTPNLWSAGQGMYVFECCKTLTANTDLALQMEGCGRGYIDFVNNVAKSPRGLGLISFTARLAQFINFDDFAYYDGDGSRTKRNYTFTARTAFDLNSCQNFRGNASLSLVAYYRPGVGCYEYRVEPYKATSSTGWDKNSVIQSLHRWNYSGGGMQDTLLGAITNDNISGWAMTTRAGGNYVPMYIAVSNDVSGTTCIMAGFAPSGVYYNSDTNGISCYSVRYRDTAAQKHTRGSYGLLSANCEGVFQYPALWDAPVQFLDNFTENDKINQYTPTAQNPYKITFPGTETLCRDEIGTSIEDTEWYINQGRMRIFNRDLAEKTGDAMLFGLVYTNGTQSISIYTAPAGTTDWTLYKSQEIEGFGSASSKSNFVYRPYTTADCAVRIAVDGTVTDVRRDVVIDDIKIEQWRGADYDEATYTIGDYIPDWSTDTDHMLSNYVFTSAWIMDHRLRLSAKRTDPSRVSSIRSPWMDGHDGRGKGLGMITFGYANAQENTILHLQICTNATEATIGSDLYGGNWETVETFRFDGLTEGERAGGSRSAYLGLHGVTGMMRLVIDEDLTKAMATNGVTDTAKFGEIEITRLYCRDEPALDESAWWGWNIRTIGASTVDNRDTEGRMYLPDLITTATSGDPGLSLAINNSATADIADTEDLITYKVNPPFVQSPTFGTNLVGEVLFKARLYDLSSTTPAVVSLFGSTEPLNESTWEWIQDFRVDSKSYRSYSYKTNPGREYKAFRFAILGADGVTNTTMRSTSGYDYRLAPQRVMIDELLVSEAVRAKVGFRNVGAFRSDIAGTAIVPNVPSPEEQPLCDEDFGFQCELFKAQLPDEVDFSVDPRVKLYWFKGRTPWGFDVWKTNAACRSAWLVKASDSTETNMVFRSSLRTAPDSVVSIASTAGQVIQYALEVEFHRNVKDGSDRVSQYATNVLTAADWARPDWYRGIDHNATLGQNRHFAAYTILDTVAPGWAWINEVNVFGGPSRTSNNADQDYQYVEIAAPAEADLSGWYVNLLAAHTSTDTVITNSLAAFGMGKLDGTKSAAYSASNMVFHCIASQSSSYNLDWNTETIDGIWSVDNPCTEISSAGLISRMYPVGFQLCRKSGIIEHEIVMVGTNFWSDGSIIGSLAASHDPTNNAAFLNEKMFESAFFYAGEDAPGTKSLGVFDSRGESSNHWNRTMERTPGRINENQSIHRPDSTYVKGENLLLYANVDAAAGHIWQQVGDGPLTNGTQIVYVRKGSSNGTNITYTVDRWYELASVTTNGAAIPWTTNAARTYTVNVGVGISNSCTVLASARLRPEIEGGVSDPRYIPAVVDWLLKGRTLRGDFEGGDVFAPAEFWSHWSHQKIGDLSLLEMYWLDMDPTVSNLVLEAGFAKPATPHVIDPAYNADASLTNVQMSVFMMISNKTEDTSSRWYGQAWTPYTLRGLEPGSNSRDDYPGATTGWTSVTFKVTGIIANGFTGVDNPEDWIPLRWFVFDENSFAPLDGSADAGTAKIEVADPRTDKSPVYLDGFWRYPDKNVFYRWAIDSRLKPYTVEMLNSNSYYKVTP